MSGPGANPHRVTNIIRAFTSTATSAGTTTLTSASNYQQFFTGSTTHTCRLPNTTTLTKGQQHRVTNLSSGSVTVATSAGTSLKVMATNTDQVYTCIDNTVDAPASWSFLTATSSSTLGGDVIGTFGANNVNTIQTIGVGATTGANAAISFGVASPTFHNGAVGIGNNGLGFSATSAAGSVGIGFNAGTGSLTNSVYFSGRVADQGDRTTSVGWGIALRTGGNCSYSTSFGMRTFSAINAQTQNAVRCVTFGTRSQGNNGGANCFSDDNVTMGENVAYADIAGGGSRLGACNVSLGNNSMSLNYDGYNSVAAGYNSHQSSFVSSAAVQSGTTLTRTNPTINFIPEFLGYKWRYPFIGPSADSTFTSIASTSSATVTPSLSTPDNVSTIFDPASYNVALGQSSLQNVRSSFNTGVGQASLQNLIIPAYRTGTISITTGTNAVTGVGTNWNVNWPVTSGRVFITFGNAYPYTGYAIGSFNSPTSITLTFLYGGSTLTNSAYMISFGGLAPGNTCIGWQSGNSITQGTGNVIIGGYNGSAAPVSTTEHDNIVFSEVISTRQKLTIAPHVTNVFNVPSTINASSYTQLFMDQSLIFTTTNCTITLLSAATYTGQTLLVKNVTANSVVSNASNVYPLGSNTLGTAILTNVAGRWAMLQSDGANWRIVMAN